MTRTLLPLVLPLASACPNETATTTDGPPDPGETTEPSSNPTTSGATQEPAPSTGTTQADTTQGATTTAALGDTTGLPGTSSTGADTSTGANDATSTGADTSTSANNDTSTGANIDTTSTGGTSTGANIDTTTTGGPGEGTTTGEGDTGEGDTTGGGPVDELECCEPGCARLLLQSHRNPVRVHHGGAAIATHPLYSDELALWDAATLEPLRFELDVKRAELVGERLVFERAGQLHIVDAADGATLAICPAEPAWGLASDASYLWTSGAGLRVRELDCGVRWSAPAGTGAAKVLAAADALHVYDPGLGAQTVTRFTAADGGASSLPFTGDFAQWFGDVPRFWSTQGDLYRLYDTDGTELEFAFGAPTHGWGTRLLFTKAVYDVYALDAPLVTFKGTARTSRGAILTYDDVAETSTLVRLDVDPIAVTPVVPDCCGTPELPFGFARDGDSWATGGSWGQSTDHLGRPITRGQIRGIAGGAGGRAAVSVDYGYVHVFDVGDACELVEHPPFPGESDLLHMPADGSLLLMAESIADGVPPKTYAGTRFYSLPDGAPIAEEITSGELKSQTVIEYDVADDGALWSIRWHNALGHRYRAETFPQFEWLHIGQADVIPKVSPSGAYVVESDGGNPPVNDWTGDHSYVYAPKQFVAVFKGVAHGFIDDDHLLVGHYAQKAFLGSEIVDIDGVVVQSTSLPEIHRFSRIGTGEILAIVEPGDDAMIFDPFTGAKLWSAPAGAEVVVAGPDHVVVSLHQRVELLRWR